MAPCYRIGSPMRRCGNFRAVDIKVQMESHCGAEGTGEFPFQESLRAVAEQDQAVARLSVRAGTLRGNLRLRQARAVIRGGLSMRCRAMALFSSSLRK
jgi:hypothetical protein